MDPEKNVALDSVEKIAQLFEEISLALTLYTTQRFRSTLVSLAASVAHNVEAARVPLSLLRSAEREMANRGNAENLDGKQA